MKRFNSGHARSYRAVTTRRERRGVVSVVSAVFMVVLFGFVAFAVDSGRIALTRSEMQNAVDAAALAAAQEITGAVFESGQAQTDVQLDASSIAVAEARVMAERVAAANGVYIDPDRDVYFGKRTYDAAHDTWPIQWDEGPYNVVRVVARKDNPDPNSEDAQLQLSFGWAVGREHTDVIMSATAFVEARDLVVVLDFSASMNDDSSIRAFNSLGQSPVENTMDRMWDAFVDSDARFPDTQRLKFTESGFGRVNSYQGTYISSNNTNNIFHALQLGATDSDGNLLSPYPQAGRDYTGMPMPEPSASRSRELWHGYIHHVKNMSGPYRKMYGYRTLMDYMQERRYDNDYSEDLWRTPHYPFHGIKEGTTMFLDFLEDLDFGDEVGLVSYGGYSQMEMSLNDGDAYVDITHNPITSDYDAIDTIQRHKQAGHYNGWTGMGYGIQDATIMLVGDANVPGDKGYLRHGARPTMLIMTDGQTNQAPEGFSLPPGWNWNDWTDYDGDGNADYTTTDSKKQYSFWQATNAINRDITIHTMSIGAGADRDLMKAIAFAGSGVWINVPGGTSVEQMESEIMQAFTQIAAEVPVPKLIHDEGTQVGDSNNDNPLDGSPQGTPSGEPSE